MPQWFVTLVQDATPRIETIWPVSVAGWVALVLAVFSAIGYAVTVWKASNRPILAKIEEAKTFFTKEMARLERDFTTKVNDQQEHIDGTLDDYHKSVTGEINGWSKRFTDDHVDIERHELALGDLAGKLIRSEEDRRQLNQRVGELTKAVAENTKETRDLERNMMRAISDMKTDILSAIKGRPSR